MTDSQNIRIISTSLRLDRPATTSGPCPYCGNSGVFCSYCHCHARNPQPEENP